MAKLILTFYEVGNTLIIVQNKNNLELDRPRQNTERNMKIDQNIKDAFKASVVIASVIILIVVCIGIYNGVTYNEAEEIYGFML